MSTGIETEMGIIEPVAVHRDEDGWWVHPNVPAFGEDADAFQSWLQDQGLQHSQWSMESDGPEDHPYWLGAGGVTHCRGWEPRSPGPDWFLLGIFDTENGPCVSWVRRVANSDQENISTPAICAGECTASPLMHRYVTGSLTHAFPWEHGLQRTLRVLVDVEGEMIAAAQVRRKEAEDSFTNSTREELKSLNQFYEDKRGIYWRPADLGLTACPEDDLPSWVVE